MNALYRAINRLRVSLRSRLYNTRFGYLPTLCGYDRWVQPVRCQSERIHGRAPGFDRFVNRPQFGGNRPQLRLNGIALGHCCALRRHHCRSLTTLERDCGRFQFCKARGQLVALRRQHVAAGDICFLCFGRYGAPELVYHVSGRQVGSRPRLFGERTEQIRLRI